MDWTPEEIRRRRDAKGLSQEELGQRLGEHLGKPVSRRAITNWEAGHAIPHGRNIRALDLVLGDEPNEHDPRLSQADYMELLAELARRYAHATSKNAGADTPPVLPPGRYVWRTEDAPSARRARSEAQNRQQPDQASDGQAL